MPTWIFGWQIKVALILGALAAAAYGGYSYRDGTCDLNNAKQEIKTQEKTINAVDNANKIRRNVSDAARLGVVPDSVRKFYID